MTRERLEQIRAWAEHRRAEPIKIHPSLVEDVLVLEGIPELLEYITRLEDVAESARLVHNHDDMCEGAYGGGDVCTCGLKDITSALSSLDAPAKKEKPDNEGGK